MRCVVSQQGCKKPSNTSHPYPTPHLSLANSSPVPIQLLTYAPLDGPCDSLATAVALLPLDCELLNCLYLLTQKICYPLGKQQSHSLPFPRVRRPFLARILQRLFVRGSIQWSLRITAIPVSAMGRSEPHRIPRACRMILAAPSLSNYLQWGLLREKGSDKYLRMCWRARKRMRRKVGRTEAARGEGGTRKQRGRKRFLRGRWRSRRL